jgi:hypothetical protein
MSTLIHNFYRGKSCPKNCATFVILQKLPKVNHRQMGENSPNLVTVLSSQAALGNNVHLLQNILFSFNSVMSSQVHYTEQLI